MASLFKDVYVERDALQDNTRIVLVYTQRRMDETVLAAIDDLAKKAIKLVITENTEVRAKISEAIERAAKELSVEFFTDAVRQIVREEIYANRGSSRTEPSQSSI